MLLLWADALELATCAFPHLNPIFRMPVLREIGQRLLCLKAGVPGVRVHGALGLSAFTPTTSRLRWRARIHRRAIDSDGMATGGAKG